MPPRLLYDPDMLPYRTMADIRELLDFLGKETAIDPEYAVKVATEMLPKVASLVLPIEQPRDDASSGYCASCSA